MLALGLLAFVVLQKHLVRPMEGQLAVYPIVAGLMFVLLAPCSLRRGAAIVMGLAGGLFFGTLTADGRLQTVPDLLADGPRRLAGVLASLSHRSGFDRANAERYAPARFLRHTDETAVVLALETRTKGPVTLFALSDSPVLYILTGQPPVWMSNMFNASPVSEQRRVSDWLTRSRPDFVVFKRDQLTLDGIQSVVRLPLVFDAVMAHYVPDGRIKDYEVMRRRNGTEAVPLDRWLELFGTSIDLGRLPTIIDAAKRPTCSQTEVCDEYVVIRTARNVSTGQPAVCALDVDGRRFDIHFQLESGVTSYTIPLSRLWIWKAAAETGVRPTVATLPSDARRAGLIKVAMDPERLY